MSQHQSLNTRFERLSREVLNGSYPYGFTPGTTPPEQFTVALECDYAPGATILLLVTPGNTEAAITLRNMPGYLAQQVLDDFHRFMEEAQFGEDGEMLPFSFLPRRVALRRLKKLLNAH